MKSYEYLKTGREVLQRQMAEFKQNERAGMLKAALAERKKKQ